MTITPYEFRRILRNAFGPEFRPSADDGTVFERCDGSIRLILSKQEPRRIGVMTLPITQLQLEFLQLSEVQIRTFMRCFDRAFQRGGG